MVLLDHFDLTADTLAPLATPEYFKCRCINTRIVDILCDLNQIVDLLDDLGDLRGSLHEFYHDRVVLATPAELGHPVCMLDVIVHLPHLAGQFAIIVPELQHLHVREFNEIDEIGRIIRIAQEGGVPREDGKIIGCVAEGVPEDVFAYLRRYIRLFPDQKGNRINGIITAVRHIDRVIFKEIRINSKPFDMRADDLAERLEVLHIEI